MIEYLSLILAIPLGMLLSKITHEERYIFEKYFPSLIWGAAFCAAVFLTTNKPIGLTISFMTIMAFSWNNDKMFKIRKKKHHKKNKPKTS